MTETYIQKINKIKASLKDAEAILIGAGAGLSAAAGLTYDGERFKRYFKDYIKEYGMKDMYSAGFYPFQTPEEKWAYWSRHIYYNRYNGFAEELYVQLYQLLEDTNYFVLTTNVDHQFWLAGFPDDKIFATQGDYGLFQCAVACHKGLYNNETAIREMMIHQEGFRIPVSLVPKCPVCGKEMEVNLRADQYFVEDDKWNEAADRYNKFLKKNKNKNLVFLELGVGMNTPGIIKYPFWQMTDKFPKAVYLCVNQGEAMGPKEIEGKSVYINEDISKVIEDIRRDR